MAMPPSFNPPSMGTGQPQQSLPNMGSPFGQNNPSQQTNPFMGGGSANNASQSPFEGAGFNNPFGGEHGAAGNPFGGGGSGGGVKGLIDSNNKLIQAINKLSTILEKMTQGRGMGGGGGLGGGLGTVVGGGVAGATTADALQMAQMHQLASRSGGSDSRPSAHQMARELDNFSGQQVHSSYMAQPDFRPGTNDMQDFMDRRAAHNQQMEQMRNYARQGGGMAPPPGAFGPTNNPRVDPNLSGLDFFNPQSPAELNALENAYLTSSIPQMQPPSRFRQFVAGAGRTGLNAVGSSIMAGLSLGAAQDLPQMLSQIPYVGGLLAAPVQALQTRVNDASNLEPLARLVAQQGNISQTGNLFKTHATLFNDFKTLGLDPGTALNESLAMQEAFGQITGVDPNSILGSKTKLADLVGMGFTGNTIGSLLRLGRGDRPLSFSRSLGGVQSIFGYAAGTMQLGDQGLMEFIGALEGLQQMVPGMGYRVDNENARKAILGQVAKNTNHGFAAAAGVQQAQRQIQGTAEMGGGLKGIFGGLAETLTMASFLGQYGDPVAAIRAFEGGYAFNPAALKGRLTKEFGRNITEMGYLSKMTSADYDNIGLENFKIDDRLPPIDRADIVFSEKQIESKLRRGTDLYDNKRAEAFKLIEINDRIEKHLVDGVNVIGMEELANSIITLTDDLRSILGTGVQLVNFITVFLRTLGIPI